MPQGLFSQQLPLALLEVQELNSHRVTVYILILEIEFLAKYLCKLLKFFYLIYGLLTFPVIR